MKNILLITIALFFTFIFTGCSSKKYYEPQGDVYNYDQSMYILEEKIIDYNPNGATLEGPKYISKNTTTPKQLEEGYSFLNEKNGAVISADDHGNLSINENGKIMKLTFDTRVISATKKDDLLALGFIDNSISLYNTKSMKTILKDYQTISVVNDIKIASPIFLETVILYPTLDGKVVIIDLETNSILKTINIDPKGTVNNIIFLDTIDQVLIAATPQKLFVFKDGRVNISDLDVKYIALGDEHIYAATLDGEILKFNQNLHIEYSKKFKFAKFLALAAGDYLYALESQGYLIRLNGDFSDVTIFDLPIDADEKVFSLEHILYFEDRFIELE